MRSTNVKCNDFTVKLDHGSNLGLVLFPFFSFSLNFSLLLIQFCLHVHIESLQKFVVGNQLIANPVVLECSIIEQVVDFGDVVRKDLLDLLDS